MWKHDFDTLSKEFGQPKRLHPLAYLVRNQPIGPVLDARIALELGWLRFYWECRGNDTVVTGVVSGDFNERYPLYASWFKNAPEMWWNDGAAICNRVPNLPRYSSDVGTAMQTIPCLAAPAACRLVIQKDTTWKVQVYDNGTQVAACYPGAECLPKALVLAGIDYRLRQSAHRDAIPEGPMVQSGVRR